MPLKTYSGSKYSIAIDVGDQLRNISSRSFRIINKSSRYSDQNFNVLSFVSNYPSFTNIFAKGEFFKIHFNQLGYDSAIVDYYSLDRALPRPVFSGSPELPLKEFPDTSYAYPLTDSTVYELPKPGIYKFRISPDSPDGLVLFNFGENFPRVKSSDDLLGPLVYLTTSAEFRDLRLESNRKLAIDNFWLSINANIESSKELIRVYYNRVMHANLYFSSYKEGWKTDRGMIYIIFGPPRMLEKSMDREKWSYYSRKSGQQVQFTFIRKENKFTDYDFQLERSIESNSIWREAVQAWRRGEIYSVGP
jgi:GWxTD domain-containing protein